MSYTVATFSNIPEICENGEIEFKGHIGIMPQYYMSTFSGSIWSDSVDCRLNEEGTLKGNYSLSGSVEDVELKLPAVACPTWSAEELDQIGTLWPDISRILFDDYSWRNSFSNNLMEREFVDASRHVFAYITEKNSSLNSYLARYRHLDLRKGIDIYRSEYLTLEEYEACKQSILDHKL